VRPDGSVRWVYDHAHPYFDEQGKLLRYLGVTLDITERKQVEDALWKSEQRFRTAIKPTFMVLAQTDLNARYTWLHNPHPDFDSDSVVGKTDIELADNDGTQMLYQSKLRVIATRQGIQTEISFPVSNGLRVFDVIIEPFYDVDGKLLGVTTSSYDMTERKLIEEELRRSNAELEQFAYIASHDLQEPLRALSGMVQLLQKRYHGQLDERADEYIRHAVDAASRMQSLIQALLSYSRAQRNNQPIELVDAGTCLQIAIKNLDASVQESHAVITRRN
jgi:signal transduction histidine kinase